MDTRSLPATVLIAGVVCLAAAPAGAQVKPAARDTHISNAGADVPVPAAAPALADLVLRPADARPADLKVAVKTERFLAGNGWCVPVVLAVDASNLASTPAAAGDAVEFQLDALAVVSDAEGRVVARLARSSRVRVERAHVATFRGERLPLTCLASDQALAPGRYTITVGVADATSNRASVLSRSVTLPDLPPPSDPVPSSLVLGRAAEACQEPDPFAVGAVRIVSNATGRFAKSRRDRIIAFFKLYGPPSVQYHARVQFLFGNRAVAATPLEPLAPIGANGETSAAPIIALDTFETGAYRAILQIFAPGSATPVATATTPFFVDP